MFRPETALSAPSSLSLSKQQRAEAFLTIENRQRRLAAIVEAARSRPPLPDAFRTEANRIQGCLVRTWFVPEVRQGRCYFRSDSDAAMLKALLGLLCDVYSGYTPEQILAERNDFLQELGVIHQLAENRQRTLVRVSQHLSAFARAQAGS